MDEELIGAPEEQATTELKAEKQADPADLALVQKLLDRIAQDKNAHDDAFKKMREDMRLATDGRVSDKVWDDSMYVANITGRHVKQKTAALYAKNPKIVARRRETLDFAVWDENPDSLMLAQQTVSLAQQPPTIDPMTGMPLPVVTPEQVMQAQTVVQDFQQGMARREMIGKLGKTLEILFNHAMRQQTPLDFKMGAKRLVRRTCTTGVGYVELAFFREYGPTHVSQAERDELQTRIAHLERLAEDTQDETDANEISAELRELTLSMESLQQEELVIVKEGLVFDYPQSTRVIPDKNCTSLVGFVGARHITIEYMFTPEEVREQFPDAALEKGYTAYASNWQKASEGETVEDRRIGGASPSGMVRVFKHFDKPSGLVYYLAEGYEGFLRAPAPPDVFVDTFWPVFALTFNDVEDENQLFPPSDARLMRHQQFEINRSRQGQSEHRIAARPRFGVDRGAIDEDDQAKLANAPPFSVIPLNLGDRKLSDVLQAIQIPGVDPNLYETGPVFQDLQLVVGSQQATMGGIAKATATESAIAANSMAASDGSSVDDLDNFLTTIAKASGQILLREMSQEKVMQIVGPGAVWPEMTLDEISDELFLEIEAGSTGKPNQAVEINNWQQLLPMLLQMPGINPVWLAKETLRRLDDRMDLVEAMAAGIPSIAATNQMQTANMVAAQGPQGDPSAQGGEGAANAPAGPSMTQGGSEPAFGSNQV